MTILEKVYSLVNLFVWIWKVEQFILSVCYLDHCLFGIYRGSIC